MLNQELVNEYLKNKVTKEQYLWDDLKGFGIRLLPSGQARYVFYKQVEGKRTFKTIGDAAIIKYIDAKKAVIKLSASESLVAEILDKGKATTLRECADAYIERHIAVAYKNPKDGRWYLERGMKELPKIRAEDLSSVHLESLRSKIKSRAGFNQTIRTFSSMWNKCQAWGMIPEKLPNPCRLVKKYEDKVRERWIEEDEIKRLIIALKMDQNILVRQAIQLILLTGCRKNEILSLEWDQINFEKGYIHWPVEKTKNKREHFYMLNEKALNVIMGIPKLESNWVFPSPESECGWLKEIRKPWGRIKKNAGIDEDITIHDLRRSIAQYLKATKEFSMDEIGGALNHKSSVTTRKHYAMFNAKNRGLAVQAVTRLF